MAVLDPRTPYLIVNADDLGIDPGVNRAIFEGHDHGIVTSTSLLAGGAAFDAAVAGARERPSLGVGVHLALHEERPILPRHEVPELVDADGNMKPLGQVVRALVLGRLPLAQAEAEYAAQIGRVLAAGIQPTHLDSHCHLHAFPALARIVHALGERFSIPCARRPELRSLGDLRGAPLSRWPVSMLISSCSKAARRGVSPSLRTPDGFVGLAQSGDVDEVWLERAIGTLAPGCVSELMVHPGDGTGGGTGDGTGDPHGDHGPAKRRIELEAVTSPRVRARITARGVHLVDYRFLAAC
jgi:predicted glycoside hydrolase/deacetylase ChbG (UPF0249 family)